ncbi:MAG: mannonate dehydratase [Atopobiaceae bacterium]|nr:mannonate dehydratase [Atopobiaceae bacterium]MCI1539741.1 mannonate dehydratase [Atopobiaceae bacterium]
MGGHCQPYLLWPLLLGRAIHRGIIGCGRCSLKTCCLLHLHALDEATDVEDREQDEDCCHAVDDLVVPRHAAPDLGIRCDAVHGIGVHDRVQDAVRCFAHGGDDGRIVGILLELGATDLVEHHAVPEVGASKEAIRRIHELRVGAHVSDCDDLDWLCRAVDSPANGITLCCGSIAEEPANDVYAILDEFSRRGRIHFVHMRNIRYLEPGKSKDFYKAPHLSREGSLDVWRMCRALFISPEAGILLLIYRLFQESFDEWLSISLNQAARFRAAAYPLPP